MAHFERKKEEENANFFGGRAKKLFVGMLNLGMVRRNGLPWVRSMAGLATEVKKSSDWGTDTWWDLLEQPAAQGEGFFPKGWKVSGVTAGLKASGRRDMALFVSDQPAAGAGVFTTNKFPAAPVEVSKEELAGKGAGRVRALLVNSGQANACTGTQGLQDAREMVAKVKALLRLPADARVPIMSTGVIGVPLEMDVIRGGLASASEALGTSRKHWEDAAHSIMTTDNRPKVAHRRLDLGGKNPPISLLGLAKGAGMIHPNMATLLGIVTTDALISAGPLKAALKYAVDRSFHSIDVDGDTSTNDTVVVMANGAAGGVAIESEGSPHYEAFREQLTDVCAELAQKIVFDAEGASRFVVISVKGARSTEDALRIGQTVAQSSLFKCAMWGGDANWGRAICAVGYSGVDYLDLSKIDMSFESIHGNPRTMAGEPTQSIPLVLRGQPVHANRAPASILCQAHKYINVSIDLRCGDHSSQVYTCDLSPDYVKFNGAYTT